MANRPATPWFTIVLTLKIQHVTQYLRSLYNSNILQDIGNLNIRQLDGGYSLQSQRRREAINMLCVEGVAALVPPHNILKLVTTYGHLETLIFPKNVLYRLIQVFYFLSEHRIEVFLQTI